MRLYTQNIDGIETSMPPLATQVPLNFKAPWPRTIQLHGSIDKAVCQKCRSLSNFDREQFDRPDAPECPQCLDHNEVRTALGQRSHGIGKLRPRIVLYNEHNPDEDAITSVMNADIRARPDALMVVGTSMKIPGVRRLVKSLCSVIKSRKNGVTMWVNNEPPVGKEFEDCFDLKVTGNCDEVARLAQLEPWDGQPAPELEPLKKRSVQVVIPPTPKKQKIETGYLTPSSSNDELVSGPPQLPEPEPVRPAKPAKKGARSTKTANTGPKKNARATSKSSKKEPTKNAGIKSFTTVTKPSSVPVGKSSQPGKHHGHAMESLPKFDVRNNGPLFPNLVKPETFE